MNAITPMVAENPRVALGDNNPPEGTPFEAIKGQISDLLIEAHNWADGTEVDSQAQVDEASRLIDELRKAAGVAEGLRVAEKKVFDDGIAEVQGRYNPLIADPKNKTPGKVWKAIDALKATIKPYLDRVELARQQAAEEARKVAQAKADEAAAAAKAAQASDLAAQEAAEDLITDARRAEVDARRIETSRTQARGGTRAMGLRTVWKAHMTDPRAALAHYAANRREDIIALLQTLADTDVREGKRSVPGFDVRSETVL